MQCRDISTLIWRSARRRDAILALALLGAACGGRVEGGAARPNDLQQAVDQALGEFTCGYEVKTGTYSQWPGGYQGWVQVRNVQGAVGTEFEVLLDVGDTTIANGYQAVYEAVDGGYLVSEPSWLEYQKIRPGQSYGFGFIGAGAFDGIVPYLISINGEVCDDVAPEVSLAASQTFFGTEGTLTLTATAQDGVAVRKVVFEQDGEVIGEDDEAPYEVDVTITDALDGRHVYTAKAYDPTGNEGVSEGVRVLVSIGDRFLGTAVGSAADYEHVTTYFNQLTPENAGKWGVVEAVRDEMNWAELDEAYEFAQYYGLRFKLHTLVWGQQQPPWLAALSPEEQLEELDEWMAALAERYPDVEMVDAVNEPLHSTPSYAEALGGVGETGWDWVVSAFEMAREHFPQAQLIVNDYQVLILPNFTSDYLQVIDVLQSRGLVDGIGVQGHFLERAEIPVVEQNLAALAATGLPIYVSELDVDLPDDARHANRLKDLFSVFWSNSSVVGVTHWGHLQGDTWRPDAYLVRTDDTTRPGMDWLQCTYAGGDDCSVPEYVPPGWTGDEYGITLEAEQYDEGQGLAALGDSVGYTDDGDWIQYVGVSLEESWDTFWVTYAKGNADVGSISVHLDSLEAEPTVVVELPPTAGWGTADTLDVPWPGVGGEHDVFIRFNDVYGVGNLDSVRIGTPAPEPESPNLVTNGDFETNTNGWSTWGSATLSTTSALAYSNSQSLVVSNRTSTGDNAVFNLTSSVSAGVTYAASAWVTHGGEGTDTVRLVAKVGCASGDSYNWLQNDTAVQGGVWTQLSGDIVIDETCDVTDVLIYFEGTSAGTDMYVDAVAVHAPFVDDNLVANGEFEAGTAGWSSWSAATLVATSERSYNGAQSLAITGRTAAGDNAVYNLTSVVAAGTTYTATLYAAHDGPADDTLRLVAKVGCESGDAYNWLQNSTGVAADQWTQLSGDIVIDETCVVTDVLIYVEGTSAGVDVFVDSVSVVAN